MAIDVRPRATAGPLRLFVAAVLIIGTAVLVESARSVRLASLSPYAVGLALLTVVSGRFSIKVPGRPATVSVSEVFVFASILVFGPALPVLTVAFDGFWVSIRQRDRRLYRALFNIAEPAISTWTAARVFFAVAHIGPGVVVSTSTRLFVPATIAMAATFFALNSGLSAIAVALDTDASAYDFWRSHAWYLAVNYYAAASLAAFAVSSGPRLNFGVAGLIVPLLLLSYVAYREAAGRIDEVQRHVADVERLYRASVEMLAIAVDAKDQTTHGHIRRVQRHTLAVATALGVHTGSELKAIEAGALLHDIGKLAIPDYVLNKPTTLTRAEFATMQKHASMGARILTAVDFPYPIVPIVRHHHERWDGRGYPDGLVGAEIPLGARILAVVDCFDALTSDRPYRRRLTDSEAMTILQARRGTFYDPAVVDRFVELIPMLRDQDAQPDASNAAASAVVTFARTPATGDARVDAYRSAIAPSEPLPVAIQSLLDDQVSRLSSSDACLFRVNGSDDTLSAVYATSGLKTAIVDRQVLVGSGVSGWVAANRNAIRRADPVLDFGEIAEQSGFRCCTSVPVFVCADLFGVLTVYWADAAPSDKQIDAVGLLAQEASVWITRATMADGNARRHMSSHLSIVAAS